MRRVSKSVNQSYRKAKAVSKGLSKYHLKNNGGFSSKRK